jgi:hypothetical protein
MDKLSIIKALKIILEGKGIKINFLKSRIVTCLTSEIHNFLNEDFFTVLAHGIGIHLDKSNNLAGDILVFDSETLPGSEIDEHYGYWNLFSKF